MWALTTYFNPVRYKRRLSNYRIFRSNLHIPLVTVELSFDGHFELTKNDADVLIQDIRWCRPVAKGAASEYRD